jgi:type I restriction enzyme S subunit
MFGDIIHNTKQWDTYIFSEVTTSRLGKMLDAKQQTGKNTLPYLANFNVQWFKFELDNLNTMDFSEKDQVEFALEDGDLLVCEGGEIGRCAIWHNEVTPCYFQKALHRIRCNKEIIIPIYLAWWFKYNCDNNGFSEIEGAKATIAHLPGVKLKKLSVVIPPLDLQQQFAAFVEQTNKSKVAVQKALDEAQLLFDSLMQEYFG